MHPMQGAASGGAASGAGPDLPSLRILVVGAGGIGTSIALAFIDRVAEVAAHDLNPRHLAMARSMGAVNRCEDSLERAADCDVAFVCVLPTSVPHVVGHLRRFSKALIIDVASVKGYLAAQVNDADLVLSHPMRGSNLSGPAAARKGLFERAPWVITPHRANSQESLERAIQLIRALGAVPVVMDPERHDRICARVSHLTHILSSAAVLTTFDGNCADVARLAGGSFRDLTRVARGNPSLWEDITIINRGEIVKCLDDYLARLEEVRRALRSGDRPAVAAFFSQAQAILDEWLPDSHTGSTEDGGTR